MSPHHVPHGQHVQARVGRHRPPVDPGILARWRVTGHLTPADIATILAGRDPADIHPVGTYVARLRAAR